MHTLSFVLLSIGGIGDWGMILLAVILLFGGKKIPELMRGLGQGINEFNRAKNSINTEIQEGVNQNMNRQQPTQNQVNSTASSTTGNTAPPANSGATDQLQKQIEQLQQTLNQLKQQQ
jgi:sec-independent protein translocase protein TatA